MGKTVFDFWTKKNKSHSDKAHGIYKLSENHLIPSVPGIYSWHIGFEKKGYNDYFKAFKQKRLDVNLKGSLKEQYSGKIWNSYHSKDFSSTTFDFDLCEYASSVFCPPVYIGISKDLKARLATHIRELEKIYTGKVKLSKPKKVGQTDFDTIIESSHFAQRIGFTLAELKSISIDSLFIKTVELDKTYAWSDLQKVEKYVNRTFIPIYGRK